jgi:23S rRNA pseudouridine1911/1915/1917 synthase
MGPRLLCGIAESDIERGQSMTRLRAREANFTRPVGVDEGAVVSVFRVPPEVEGQRMDVFVQSQLRRTSRTRTQEIIRLSAYDAGGKRLRVNDRVHGGQHVLLWRAPWDENPVPRNIGVLYEDDHLLAVDKPANLPVHPTARYHKNTLIKMVQAARPGEFIALGHRIDRETSGVLLLAKSLECERALKKQLADRDRVEKAYIALTWGVPDWPGGGPRFRYERSMLLDTTSPYRVKMIASEHPDALSAATRFEVVATKTARGKVYARVLCDLETGRQHQIRVHLAELGAPIVGDKLYGPDEGLFGRSVDGGLTLEDAAVLEIERHALHAHRLALDHPITRDRLVIESPLPADLALFWDSLGA